MARKSTKKPDKKPTKPAGRSAVKRKTTSEREPWTPWGKWLKQRRERRERKQRERQERQQKRQLERRRRWSRRRLVTTRGLVFLLLMVLACVVAGIVLLALGRPYPWENIAQVSEALRLTRQLDEKQARWESLAIEQYTVVLDYEDNTGIRCGPAELEVVGGELVDPPSPAETHWFPPETCQALAEQLLVENAYGWLQGQIAQYQPGKTYLTIEFDPQFGYPVYAEAGVYDEDGGEPGCCWSVSWQDLQPVYEDE